MFVWRNIKLSFKLFFGFGILLFVFLAAVVVSWVHLARVGRDGDYVNHTVAPTVEIAARLSNSLSELFESVTLMQDAQTGDQVKSTVTVARAALAVTQSLSNQLIAAGEADPTLQTPKAFQEKLLPSYKLYEESVERNFSLLDNHTKNFAAQSASGRELTSVTEKFVQVFTDELDSALRNNDMYGIRRHIGAFRMSSGIAEAIQNMRLAMYRADLTNDPKAMSAVADLTPTIKKRLEEMKTALNSRSELDLLEEMTSAFLAYEKDLSPQIKNFSAMAAERDARAKLLPILKSESTNLDGLAMERIKAFSSATASGVNRSIFLLIACTGAAVLLGLLMAFLISRSIAAPLRTIVSLAGRIGSGDLTVARRDFDYEGEDELGELSGALAEMVVAQESSIRGVVGVAARLRNVTAKLRSIAGDTNATMERMVAGVGGMSGNLRALASTSEEMNASVKEVAAAAQTTAEKGTDIARKVDEAMSAGEAGKNSMHDVAEGIGRVAESSGEAASAIVKLGESARQIQNIVSQIAGIADQTNLLALNAAIEAARAGEAGRGFAVVAEEVRKLAEDSRVATKNIDGLAAVITSELSMIEKYSKENASGSEKVRELSVDTEHAITTMIDNLGMISGATQDLAAVAEEQAASSEEIAESVRSMSAKVSDTSNAGDNIRQSAKETSDSARDILEQVEELNKHEEILAEALSRFKLSEQGTRGGLRALSAPADRTPFPSAWGGL
jgi:methyl-accepting chemotaxis protein